MNKKVVFDTMKAIATSTLAVLIFAGFMFFWFLTVKSCDESCDNYRNSLPTYHASYGSFINGRSSTDFETYKVENNHYTFFDANGKLVGDFTVSGNNKIFITRNIK